MGRMIRFASRTDYWFSSTLTIIPAALVTAVILVSSRADNDQTL